MEAGQAGGRLSKADIASGIFRQPKYLTAASASGAAFFALLAFTSGTVVWGRFEANPFADPGRIAMNALIAALFGANVGVLLHNRDMKRGAEGGTQMTATGAFFAFITSSCPFCQPILLLSLGLGGLGALIGGLSIAIGMLSIGLMAFSLKKGLQSAGGKCG